MIHEFFFMLSILEAPQFLMKAQNRKDVRLVYLNYLTAEKLISRGLHIQLKIILETSSLRSMSSKPIFQKIHELKIFFFQIWWSKALRLSIMAQNGSPQWSYWHSNYCRFKTIGARDFKFSPN